MVFDNPDDTMVVAENYLNSIVGFEATNHVQYIGTADPDPWTQYGFMGYPTTILIDRDGNIRQQALGAFDQSPTFDAWEATIQELTGAS